MHTKVWMIVVPLLALLAGAALVLLFFRPLDRDADAPASIAATVAGDTEVAVQTFLAAHASTLDVRRPRVSIMLEPMANDDVRTSKVGGQPYWTSEREYPQGSDGRPMFLLAQIDFGAMPRPLKGYPRDGLLQFFIAETEFYGANFEGDMSFDALQEQRNFRVVYWPDTKAAPIDVAVRDSDRLPFVPTQPRRMAFTGGVEPLSAFDYRFHAVFGSTDAYTAGEEHARSMGVDPEAFIDALWETRSGSGHKIGGYPYFTQQDPRSEGPYELLFQLDTDDRMMWGDAGVAGFFIDPAALARADFSRVAYSWDCH